MDFFSKLVISGLDEGVHYRPNILKHLLAKNLASEYEYASHHSTLVYVSDEASPEWE